MAFRFLNSARARALIPWTLAGFASPAFVPACG